MDLVLSGFADELTKIARSAPHMAHRLAVTGGLGAGAFHGASRAKSSVTGDYGPEGTTLGAVGKGAAGGVLLAAILGALSRMGR